MPAVQDHDVRAPDPQPAPPARLLLGHRPLTLKSAGFSALAYGAFIAVAGTFVALYMLVQRAPAGSAGVHDIRFAFAILFAGICLPMGIYFCVRGVRDLLAEAARKRWSRRQPVKPWLGDYAWSSTGCRVSAWRETAKLLAGALIGSAAVAPFVWIALGTPSAWAFDAFVCLLAVLPAMAWWRWIVMLRQTLRFGSSFLQYGDFPFFLGTTLSAQLVIQWNQRLLQSLTVTLRCVREKYVTIGQAGWGGGNRTTYTECHELFSQVLVFDENQIMQLGGHEIPLEFPVPADAPSTSLASHPPTYWEIEAAGETSGAAYSALFLVPVYPPSH